MRWVGGPLDGCAEDIPRPTSVWIGPDVTAPKTKVVVYVFFSRGEYRFNEEATKWANDRLQARYN
jgi:hypothetical protein